MMYLRNKMGWILAGAGLSMAATIASGQSASPMSAREVFYTPLPQTSEKAPAKPAQAGTKAAVSKAAAPKAKAPDPQAPATPAVVATKAPEPQAPATPASDTPFVPVKLTHNPLGIRLSIVKLPPSGPLPEVPPEVPMDTNFQPGDRVRLNIRVNDKGYLYIINRGSSGTWTQLFPSPDLPDASNAVAPGVIYSVPPGGVFVVGNPPGAEKLFIILSRTPELDIQSLTMDMSRRQGGNSAPNEPPSQPPARQPPPTTIAQNLPPMNDGMVDRLRTVYARDLVIEKVDEQTPGTNKENAVYAVNPGDGNDTRVVLDAQILHR